REHNERGRAGVLTLPAKLRYIVCIGPGEGFPTMFRYFAIALLFAGAMFAQSSSGVISGRVLDESNQTIAGASITVVREGTGEARNVSTEATGEFVFTSLQPGNYDLTVKADGFRMYQKTGLALSASER